MLPTSIPLRRMTRLPHVGTRIAFLGVGDVGGHVGGEVAPDVDVAVVEPLAVRAGDEVRRARDEVVDDDDRVAGADRRAVAGLHPGRPDLLDRRRPDAADRAGRVAQLGLVDLVVAAHDRRHEAAVARHEERRLRGPAGVDAEERGERRRSWSCRAWPTSSRGSGSSPVAVGLRDDRDLAVGGVAARLAQDQDVLAGRVEHHELVGAGAAHHPDVGRRPRRPRARAARRSGRRRRTGPGSWRRARRRRGRSCRRPS